jgi:hypothetical protein
MRLQYLHKAGGHRLSAPSGAVYAFEEDAEGRRVAEIDDEDDAAWFLNLEGHTGAKLFVAMEDEAGADGYDAMDRKDLLILYEQRFGKPAGGRTKTETLIEALKAADETSSTAKADEALNEHTD